MEQKQSGVSPFQIRALRRRHGLAQECCNSCRRLLQVAGRSSERSKFVVAGDHPPSLLANIKARWEKRGLPPDNFVALGHVSDRDLVHLYRAASLLIQPSLMEGFGLTALEAMMCGAPVIGSSRGALPEVIRNPDLMLIP